MTKYNVLGHPKVNKNHQNMTIMGAWTTPIFLWSRLSGRRDLTGQITETKEKRSIFDETVKPRKGVF